MAGTAARLPPRRTVSNDFEAWRVDGTRGALNDALQARVRREAGREPTPGAGSIDSQTVKSTEVGGPHGFDGAKGLTGRKRHIAVDSLGLLLARIVTGTSVNDGAAAPRILGKIPRGSFPRLKKFWADKKYHDHEFDR